jgi:hypothetical protein
VPLLICNAGRGSSLRDVTPHAPSSPRVPIGLRVFCGGGANARVEPRAVASNYRGTTRACAAKRPSVLAALERVGAAAGQRGAIDGQSAAVIGGLERPANQPTS